MTISVSVVDNQAYTAGPGWRYAFTSFLGSGGLVQGATDMPVTALSTPNMTVNVGTGQCWIEGTYLTSSESGVTVQGDYWVQNDTVYNLPIPAANSSLGRIDLVCVVVTDSNEGQAGSTGATIIDVPGTPSASPVAPTAPVSSIVLAQINVPAAATSITSSDITLLYPQATLNQAMNTPIQAISTAGPPTGQYGAGSAVLDSGGYLWVNPGGSFQKVQSPEPTPPTFNAARVYIGTSQTGITGDTTINGWTQDWVYGNMTTSATGITIPTTGLYRVELTIQVTGNAAPIATYMDLLVGTTIVRSTYNYHDNSQAVYAIADVIQLSASDVVGAELRDAGTTTLATSAGSEYSWLTVTQIVEA